MSKAKEPKASKLDRLTAAKLVAEDALAEAHIKVVTASKSGDLDALEAAQRALSEAETKARLAALAVVKHLDAAALALVKQQAKKESAQQAKKESAAETPPVVATWEVKEATDPRCTPPLPPVRAPCVCPLCVPPVPLCIHCVLCVFCVQCVPLLRVCCVPPLCPLGAAHSTQQLYCCVCISSDTSTSLLCVLDCRVCLIALFLQC